jgi:two-component system, chemotaxis family, chemotaxis protein CheY
MKVLVVEDDELSLNLLQSVLETFEVEVHSFSSGRAARTAIGERAFDCLCLDLEMPEVHGFELAREARKSQLNHSTPIIIITGRDQKDTMKESFAVGGTFFLQKPVDRATLRKLLSTAWGTMLEARRRTALVPVQLDTSCRSGKHVFHAAAVAIGQQEIMLEAAPALSQGSQVQMAFTLPGEKSEIRASGSVGVVAGRRTRVRFIELNRADLARIRELVIKSEAS